MAYGQTGTGKTYTLGSLGGKDSSQKGIMARAMEQLLESTDRNADSLSISYLQLYNERVQDLLSPDKDNLAVQEDNKTGEVQVPGKHGACRRDYQNSVGLCIFTTCVTASLQEIQ